MHPEIESHSSRQTSAASWGQIQCEWAFSIIFPCPASRPDYRIDRLVASGAESVTNQRPEGLFILRRVADHGPIGANGVIEDQLNRWGRISDFCSIGRSIVDSLALRRTCCYHTYMYNGAAAPSHVVGRNTITREVLSC